MKKILPQVVSLYPKPIPEYNANNIEMYMIAIVMRYVATAMSLACQVIWTSNFVVSTAWPFMYQTMGPYSSMTFGNILLATFLFMFFYLPETSGRSIAEVQNAVNEPQRSYIKCCGGIAEEVSQGLWDHSGPTTSGSASSDVVIDEVDLHSIVWRASGVQSPVCM